jgi:hypothetical protein
MVFIINLMGAPARTVFQLQVRSSLSTSFSTTLSSSREHRRAPSLMLRRYTLRFLARARVRLIGAIYAADGHTHICFKVVAGEQQRGAHAWWLRARACPWRCHCRSFMLFPTGGFIPGDLFRGCVPEYTRLDIEHIACVCIASMLNPARAWKVFGRGAGNS